MLLLTVTGMGLSVEVGCEPLSMKTEARAVTHLFTRIPGQRIYKQKARKSLTGRMQAAEKGKWGSTASRWLLQGICLRILSP